MSRNDYGLRFGETKQYFGNFPDGRTAMKRGGDVMPKRNKKNFRPTEKGAGMTRAGVAAYRRANPGSKLKQRSLAKSNQDLKLLKDVNHSAQEVQDK